MSDALVSQNLGLLVAVGLFGLYGLLWRIKKRELRRTAQVEADVMPQARTAVQKYFAALARVLSVGLVAILSAHLSFIPLGTLTGRFFGAGSLLNELVGLGLGIAGLSLCRLAQVTIGGSWRVGIDEDARTGLVTHGIYRLIRNPTYSGLFLVCLGVFVALPTYLLLYWILAFVLLMEFQVRCEEDWLETTHGEAFRQYRKTSKRYLPFVW